MSHVVIAGQLRVRCLFQPGRYAGADRQSWDPSCMSSAIFGRAASSSKRPPTHPKFPIPAKIVGRKGPELVNRKRQLDSSKQASQFLNNLVSKKGAPSSGPRSIPPEVVDVRPSRTTPSRGPVRGRGSKAPGTVEIDDEEAAIQQEIVKNRRKILWPGIWTFFAVTATCGTLAYLDARSSASIPSAENELPERIQIPQPWYLTPSVIREGIKVGWQEVDKLTIGIVVASIAIHFLKKSPLPIWEHLSHVTGERKYTAFTYPYVHSTWLHLAQNMWGVCWFLPGVVHAFDGDLFHAAALFTTVPLITSYLTHFVFRWGNVPGLPFNMGSSGAIAALIGVFCVTYPDEKIWVPESAVFRIDAKYYAAFFVALQLNGLLRQSTGGARPAVIVSSITSPFFPMLTLPRFILSA
jgi:membrane associated rhomboid family serine protease